MLTASLISTVFGTKLPGPGCIYLSQTLKFLAPVRVGETVRAEVTIKSIDRERRRCVFETICKVGGKNVLEGEAVIMVPRRRPARRLTRARGLPPLHALCRMGHSPPCAFTVITPACRLRRAVPRWRSATSTGSIAGTARSSARPRATPAPLADPWAWSRSSPIRARC